MAHTIKTSQSLIVSGLVRKTAKREPYIVIYFRRLYLMTNLLFPARGDGTLVLGSPGPSVKEKKENKDKDMVF